jgi:hypothetical protein
MVGVGSGGNGEPGHAVPAMLAPGTEAGTTNGCTQHAFAEAIKGATANSINNANEENKMTFPFTFFTSYFSLFCFLEVKPLETAQPNLLFANLPVKTI